MKHKHDWQSLLGAVSNRLGIEKESLDKKGRGHAIVKAREACIFFAMSGLGMSGQEVANRLHQNKASVSRAYYRASEWIGKEAEWAKVLS